MKQQEKRIVALSVAVTLLGGWVTMGEASAANIGPACETDIVSVGSGTCPSTEGERISKCNEEAPTGCGATSGTCMEAAPGQPGYGLICVFTDEA
jgi:hypothetical protein